MRARDTPRATRTGGCTRKGRAYRDEILDTGHPLAPKDLARGHCWGSKPRARDYSPPPRRSSRASSEDDSSPGRRRATRPFQLLTQERPDHCKGP